MTPPPAPSPPSGPHRQPVTGRTRDVVIALDRMILALSRHWLLFISLFVLAYVGIPFLAPVMMKAGVEAPARAIYTVYGGLCHQLGYRSWYLFGERATYPRDIFEAYTGIDTDDPNHILAARAYVGNERVGYKVAYCERDVAIYGALFLGGVLYAVPGVRRRLRPLSWPAYIAIGLVPIGLDGFSQLFSQYPYNLIPGLSLLPYRESTAALRTLTGSLFGLANAWLAYPYVQATMTEIERDLSAKLARVDAQTSR